MPVTAKREVANALMIFKSRQKSGDYYNDVNAENYKKWVKAELILNLTQYSVLIIDNDLYHNRRLHRIPKCRKG